MSKTRANNGFHKTTPMWAMTCSQKSENMLEKYIQEKRDVLTS